MPGTWKRGRVLPGPPPRCRADMNQPAAESGPRRPGIPEPAVRSASPCQQATETRQPHPELPADAAGARPEGTRQVSRPDPPRGAERPGCRSRSCTSSHDVRLITKPLHVRRIAWFTWACDAEHAAAGMCSQCAQRSARRVPSPGKRPGGRSVSYPRSDLNRHWGPF